jgi:protein involved in polysaccharide export with SLBB domain
MNRALVITVLLLAGLSTSAAAQSPATNAKGKRSGTRGSVKNQVETVPESSRTAGETVQKPPVKPLSAPTTEMALSASTNSVTKPAAADPESLLTTIYRVGVGDVLDVRIRNGGFNGSTLFTVLEGGLIDFPLLGGSVKVAGMTTDEIQTRLAAEFQRRALQESVDLKVGVRQYTSHSVIVTGLVVSGGTKVLRREAVPLYVILAESQSRLDAARAHIMRPNRPVMTLDLTDPSSSSVLIQPGDVINITARPELFYYIGGRINSPGQKNFQAGITLLQAILAAGGLRQADGVVEMSRDNANGNLTTTKYVLKNIKSGKIPDPRLQPGDRIEVLR